MPLIGFRESAKRYKASKHYLGYWFQMRVSSIYKTRGRGIRWRPCRVTKCRAPIYNATLLLNHRTRIIRTPF
jgi:hypothetical protein